MNVNKT